MCLALWIVLFTAQAAQAEWYTGLYTGVNFADDLHNVEGTGGLAGLRAPDFDLKNSIVYGAKLGNYFGHSWFGVEGEVFNSTPHVKNLDDIPGFHLRVTTLALNIVGRYPGRSVQPYGGIGFALLAGKNGGVSPPPGRIRMSARLSMRLPEFVSFLPRTSPCSPNISSQKARCDLMMPLLWAMGLLRNILLSML